MKKFIVVIGILTVYMNAWEINTHRAIEREAIKQSYNLKTFVTNAAIKNVNFRNNIFEGYTNIITRRPVTYFDYINKKYSNDGVSEWGQTFDSSIRDYQDLIETGAILEDAVYDTAPLSFNGRFNNHFYDAQNGGHALTFGYGIRVNALKWGINGTHVGAFSRENKYSHLNALNYFSKAFTESNPATRRKYQAKMLVSVGHLLHLMNDMTSPAHTRDDSHPLDDVMEVCGRGGESGDENKGYRIKGNSLVDKIGIDEYRFNKMPKYSKFSNFISKEASWVSTHFFSRGTIFTKPKPSVSDTYESFASSIGGIDKYYIKSYSSSGIPSGTKLAIKIKSYIIRGLKRYYTGSSSDIMFDKASTFRGDYTVLKENAKILIPRAIANARNFLDYFFRGQISAKITDNEIIITNVSDTSLVAKGAATLGMHGALRSYHNYRFMYENSDGTRHPLHFRYDVKKLYDEPKLRDSIAYSGSVESPPIVDGFSSNIDVKPGKSIKVPIVLDYDQKVLLRNKKIIAIFDGTIGKERSVAICNASTPSGHIIVAH